MSIFSSDPSSQKTSIVKSKIMQSNRLLIAVLITACFGISCKKTFLDVDDTTFLYRQSFVKNLSTMQQFLNGIYYIQATNLEFGTAPCYPELVADNLKPIEGVTPFLLPHYGWAQQADEKDQQEILAESAIAMNPIWTVSYRLIRACSFVIEDTDKYRDENPEKANSMRGQAYALRALLHFKLVNIFAQPYNFSPAGSHPGIPYVKSADISDPLVRVSVAKGYEEIISDYTNAIELLPENVTDLRFMNRTAARALLARAYLFKEDNEKAKTLAAEIAGEVPLMSVASGYPDDIFKMKSPGQTETLFQLTPKHSGYTIFLGALLSGPYEMYKATNDIAEILKENPADVRSAWVSGNPYEYTVRKFPADAAPEIPSVDPVEGAYYPAVIRSSEMFLTVAEAAAKSGDETTAKTFLNAIRQRSDPAAILVTATGSALLDSIYKERRKELSFEGLRMYDLLRWKKGVNRIDAASGYPKVLPFPSNKAIAPIPPSDVTLAGMSQNPGY
jgi:starch-binding outer membrane protein, SusD/RagB family